MNLTKIADRTLQFSFYLLFFLVPLIMTPWNFELFEYNKMMLTYALTAVIVGAWLAKMILTRQLIFRRTPFDIPLLILLISQSLSLLFSIDRHTSLWGYYSRFHGGLLSTVSYLLLYWAFVSNFDKQKTLSAIRYTLYAATLVALYGVAEHFGIDAQYWVQDVKNRVFSTLGQPNWLAAWLAALLPLSLGLALASWREGEKARRRDLKFLLSCSLALLLLLCLFFTKSRSGIPSAFLGLAFFSFLLALPKILILKRVYLSLTSFIFFLAVITSGLLVYQKLPNLSQDLAYILGLTNQVKIHIQQPGEGGSASGDIRKVVWRGAVDIWKHYPIFGSGVETFAYSYYQFRPPEHNLLSEWDFLYNKAHNEYFNFLATTGALGLGSYLLLIGWIVWWHLKVIRDTQDAISNTSYHLLLISLFAGWLSILITNFFGFSVVPVALFFFLFPAFAIVLLRKEEPKPPTIRNTQYAIRNTQYAALALVLFPIFYFLFSILRMWQADVAFAQGNRLNKQGDYILAYNALQKAINLNPGEPTYRDELAWSEANLALAAWTQKNQALSQQLRDLALVSSNQALAVSPRHLNFYRTRAKVFFRLAQIDPKFLQDALETLLQAKKLAPTDAKIFYNLALVQEALGQPDQAIQTLEETARIKTNYVEARYALALLYKETGESQKAIEQLEYLLQNLGGYQDTAQKLKEWKGK